MDFQSISSRLLNQWVWERIRWWAFASHYKHDCPLNRWISVENSHLRLFLRHRMIHLHLHLSRSLIDRWGTAHSHTILRHLSLFSAGLIHSPNLFTRRKILVWHCHDQELGHVPTVMSQFSCHHPVNLLHHPGHHIFIHSLQPTSGADTESVIPFFRVIIEYPFTLHIFFRFHVWRTV